jgi:DNA-binding GntR family transcriptional regulator
MSDHDELAAAIGVLWSESDSFAKSSDAVYLTLREAILSKALKPGQLFTEEDLAKVFSVSRTPVREAVLRLTSDHLLDRRGGRRLAVSAMSPAEVLEIYDVRGALDALAARLAATEATPPDVAQLRWLNQQMEEAVASGDVAEAFRLNLEFHDYLARMSRNTFLLRQVRVVQDRVRRFTHTTFELSGRPDKIIAEHQQILQAIEAGDPEAAAAAANEHIMHSKDIRLAMLDTEQDRDAGPRNPLLGSSAD